MRSSILREGLYREGVQNNESSEELVSVRHRLENKYGLSVSCSPAYRLESSPKSLGPRSPTVRLWNSWTNTYSISGLNTQIRFGQQVKTYFLNISKKMQEISKKSDFKNRSRIIEVQFRWGKENLFRSRAEDEEGRKKENGEP